jgi:hypothetical protein
MSGCRFVPLGRIGVLMLPCLCLSLPLPCGVLLFRKLFIVGRMRPKKGLGEEAKKKATMPSGRSCCAKLEKQWIMAQVHKVTGGAVGEEDELVAQDSGPSSVIVFCNRGAGVRAEPPARLTSCFCHFCSFGVSRLTAPDESNNFRSASARSSRLGLCENPCIDPNSSHWRAKMPSRIG